ncbi:MAG TPA: 3-phosphoshikimate 1-carboxyvinyltransferase [Aquaticitalea sp.]|nr:3-phosphoshikimate 1-carboxyvinyltransferase [Aquaticitalea sp.]
MDIKLSANTIIASELTITGSKSETNRLLLLQALYPQITIKNGSNSDDSVVMQQAIADSNIVSDTGAVKLNIHHAGTAIRFLTAYFAIQEGKEVILTGSERMKQRPIKILVEALRQLGANISYEENEGFPPIKIIGTKLTGRKISLPASVSSQYISALLLIAPKLGKGLELTLKGDVTSAPYINMTLALLNEIGVKTTFEGNVIRIKSVPEKIQPKLITVESDWSSASYWYAIVALSKIGTTIKLSTFKKNSLQADAALVEIYKNFGVETRFAKQSITLKKTATHKAFPFGESWDGASSPDIAQTIAVTCFALGIGCHLTGLHTLKIKETDRLEALKIELTKLGANVSVTNDSLTLDRPASINAGVTIATYQDHRMAMAFAPLALKMSIAIQDPDVVSKSYPGFWDHLQSVGFQISK